MTMRAFGDAMSDRQILVKKDRAATRCAARSV
jgi:hypothetical protein